MSSSSLSWLEALGQMLDDLRVGMCLFDGQDQAQLWNGTFLRFFPEHEGHIRRGEHYRENLRRFYRQRLTPEEMAQLEHYVEAGIARHQGQFHPFDFQHHGRQLTVSSLPLPGIGRLRLWRQDLQRAQADEATGQPPADGGLLLDRVPSGLMLCEADGHILWVNAPFVALYGLSDARAAVGRTLQDVFRSAWERVGAAGQRPPLLLQQPDTLREMMRFAGAPFELPLPGGRHCRVLERSGATGAGHLFAHVDITELVRQRERLAQAEREARVHAEAAERESALLQAVLRSMEQGIALVNGEGRVEYHNQRLLQLLDLPAQALAQRPLDAALVRGLRERGDLQVLAPQGGPASPLVVRQRTSGRVLEIGSVGVPGGGMLRTVSDVTERHTHQQHIEHLASHYALTGLLNRGRFLELLAAEVALAGRTQGCLAVLYLDLDGFKPINDTHGHAVGDQVLLHVARALAREVRVTDFAARLGGDEFAVLQRGLDTPGQAWALAERVRRAIQEPCEADGTALCVGASVGVALYPQDGTGPEALLHAADRAMYQAKAASRSAAAAAAPPPPAGR